MKLKFKRTIDPDWKTGQDVEGLVKFMATLKPYESALVRMDCPHTKTRVETRFKRCVKCRDILGEVE